MVEVDRKQLQEASSKLASVYQHVKNLELQLKNQSLELQLKNQQHVPAPVTVQQPVPLQQLAVAQQPIYTQQPAVQVVTFVGASWRMFIWTSKGIRNLAPQRIITVALQQDPSPW